MTQGIDVSQALDALYDHRDNQSDANPQRYCSQPNGDPDWKWFVTHAEFSESGPA